MCYLFDKNSGNVLGFVNHRSKALRHATIELQFPERLNSRQKRKLILDDENPGWMKIKNWKSGEYMRNFIKDETLLAKCKIYLYVKLQNKARGILATDRRKKYHTIGVHGVHLQASSPESQ